VAILRELGYGDEDIDAMVSKHVTVDGRLDNA
jgi:hypothetical protein